MQDEKFINQLSESLLAYQEHNGKTVKYISHSHDDILNYIRFDQLLQKLADTKISFTEKKNQIREYLNTNNIYLYYMSRSSGVHSVPYLSKTLEEVIPYNNKEYTPHINAYFRWLDSLKDLKLDSLFTGRDLAKSPNAIENEILMLDSLFEELQSEATKADFKKAIKAFHRSNRNLKSYMTDLIAYKANLLLIRLDLGFNKDYIDKTKWSAYENLATENQITNDADSTTDAEATEVKTHLEKRIDLENMLLEQDLRLIKDYRAKFFRTIKRKYNVKGFIWKLEYGGDKSFHYHCLIMLDGDLHREDITIAQDMGELWKQITTDESTGLTRGIYWNCNAHKEKYRHLAIGQLNASDTTMINNLFTYVLPYLAKTDYYLKIAKSSDRSIGMGNDKVKIKSGRPRKTMANENAAI